MTFFPWTVTLPDAYSIPGSIVSAVPCFMTLGLRLAVLAQFLHLIMAMLTFPVIPDDLRPVAGLPTRRFSFTIVRLS